MGRLKASKVKNTEWYVAFRWLGDTSINTWLQIRSFQRRDQSGNGSMNHTWLINLYQRKFEV